MSIAGYKKAKRLSICLIALWFVFLFTFAEEPRSLLRAIYKKPDILRLNTNEKYVRVISLNCGGGNINAAKEIIQYSPDIVLLQESPPQKQMNDFIDQLFDNSATLIYGMDTSIIITKGQLKNDFPDQQHTFITKVIITFNNVDILLANIRLMPPEIEFNLLTPKTWCKHRDDRQERRKQIAKIENFLNESDIEKPVVVGGDFNVKANDGTLRPLNKYLTDAFTKAGTGWGHTAINDFPVFRVDQIWVSKHFKVISCFARKTVYSDHRMVICDLMVK